MGDLQEFSFRHKSVLCPMCLGLAISQEFSEIPSCNLDEFTNKELMYPNGCEDCPIDWSKLRINILKHCTNCLYYHEYILVSSLENDCSEFHFNLVNNTSEYCKFWKSNNEREKAEINPENAGKSFNVISCDLTVDRDLSQGKSHLDRGLSPSSPPPLDSPRISTTILLCTITWEIGLLIIFIIWSL